MERLLPHGLMKRMRILSSVLALLSIVFHIGLAAVHCHDLDGLQGKVGVGVERLQDPTGQQTADEHEENCVICQLLAVGKGTATEGIESVGSTFTALIVLLGLWQSVFVPLPRRSVGHPRAPPLAVI